MPAMLPLFSFRRLIVAALLFSAPVLRAEKWTTFPDCTMDESAYADGDSFHIHSGSREMIIRLYFVDCPETDEKFPDRVATQAAYFGITSKQALKLGEKAADFTRRTISGHFAVVTQFEDARGNSSEPRYYGFVMLDGGKKNFAEMLVENGLARVYGAPARRPGGLDVEAQWQHLRRLEDTAKSRHLGGWGGGAPESGAPKTGSSNEEFFQRARATPTPTALPAAAPAGSPSATLQPGSQTAIDLNSATQDELERLPKIGKVLAARIIATRPYTSVEDLRRVQGIKAATLEAIINLVCVKAN